MWISANNDISRPSQILGQSRAIRRYCINFFKAFDCVPHQELLLKHYGIKDSLLGWLDNFITKRSQRVVVNGQSSEWAPVTSGFLQGTVLGPLQFLAFINDLTAGLTSKAHLFADDCLIYRSISSKTNAEAFQADLNSLHQWSSKWQLKFNVCHTMRITLRRNIIDTKYNLGGSTLSMVTEYQT